jgi:hypothetical protein
LEVATGTGGTGRREISLTITSLDILTLIQTTETLKAVTKETGTGEFLVCEGVVLASQGTMLAKVDYSVTTRPLTQLAAGSWMWASQISLRP